MPSHNNDSNKNIGLQYLYCKEDKKNYSFPSGVCFRSIVIQFCFESERKTFHPKIDHCFVIECLFYIKKRMILIKSFYFAKIADRTPTTNILICRKTRRDKKQKSCLKRRLTRDLHIQLNELKYVQGSFEAQFCQRNGKLQMH